MAVANNLFFMLHLKIAEFGPMNQHRCAFDVTVSRKIKNINDFAEMSNRLPLNGGTRFNTVIRFYLN